MRLITLLLFAVLIVPEIAYAVNCNISDSTYTKTVIWTPPTEREADANGVIKKLKLSEIKRYTIRWEDINEISKHTCTRVINVPSATSSTINLASATSYSFTMTATDTGGRESAYSKKIFYATGGEPSKPDPTSPPGKVTDVKVYNK